MLAERLRCTWREVQSVLQQACHHHSSIILDSVHVFDAKEDYDDKASFRRFELGIAS